MSQPQLQLHVVKVRVARPDRAGHDPAAAGTHVWLDVPTEKFRDFAFQEFVVNVQGGLDAVAGNASKTASIDRSRVYWCLWSPKDQKLNLPSKFDPDDLDVVAGFGRPLIAVLTDKTELILPNTRKVFIREFNLSGLGETNEIKQNRDRAVAFYKDLHIELVFRAQQKPANQSDLFVAQHNDGIRLHDVRHIKSPDTAPAVSLPLDQPPFKPDTDFSKTILLIWVQDFIKTGVQGEAYHPFRLLRGFRSGSELLPSGPDYSVVIVSAKASLGRASAAAANGPEPLAHELGHVLWGDIGSGRVLYNDTKHQLGPAHLDYQGKVDDLLRDQLGLPVPDVITPGNGTGPATQFVEPNSHHRLPNNLMNAFPANTGVNPKALTFIQIGLFRLAPELRWDGES